MANIQQNYIPGEAFNTYFLSDLTAQNPTDWTWEHRTLSCYKTELYGNIPLGGELTLNEQYGQISGVWQLDKLNKVVLCCLGTTGEISIKITENNMQYPLADAQHPYVSTAYLTSTAEHNVYYGTNVSADVIPAEGTYIRSIKWNVFYTDNGSGNYIDPNTQINAGSLTSDANGLKNLYISVDYIQGGTLEYFSNKNTRNLDA